MWCKSCGKSYPAEKKENKNAVDNATGSNGGGKFKNRYGTVNKTNSMIISKCGRKRKNSGLDTANSQLDEEDLSYLSALGYAV